MQTNKKKLSFVGILFRNEIIDDQTPECANEALCGWLTVVVVCWGAVCRKLLTTAKTSAFCSIVCVIVYTVDCLG